MIIIIKKEESLHGRFPFFPPFLKGFEAFNVVWADVVILF